MLQVICEKTGLQFEAAAKRTKNHPKIMMIINEANKDNWYRECLAALHAGREAGLDTLEDFLALLQETKTAALNQQMIDYRAKIAEKKRDKERNRILNEAYRNGLIYREDDELDSGIQYAQTVNRSERENGFYDQNEQGE